jgi:hypothetical protein
MRRLMTVLLAFLIPGAVLNAQTLDNHYYKPYVIPVAMAGGYFTFHGGTPMPAQLNSVENYQFNMIAPMLQGLVQPRFKYMASFEAGWSFPKTRLRYTEKRNFQITGDISIKASSSPFAFEPVNNPAITAQYTKAINSIGAGAGINLNYRILRVNFIKLGAKVYPGFQTTPELYSVYKQTTAPAATSYTVVTSSRDNIQVSNLAAYSFAQPDPVFNLQYSLSAEVVLFKKLIAGISYTNAMIEKDYRYLNFIDYTTPTTLDKFEEKSFAAAMDYSYVSLKVGLYLSRGYRGAPAEVVH